MLRYIIILLLFASSFPAWADDTVEAAATGNIIFEKTKEIIMLDETLQVSKFAGKNFYDEKFSIDVDFHFKNISNQPVTRKIAFVLPPVVCQIDVNSMWGGLESTQQLSNTGLKDFSGTVDGRPLQFTKREEAKIGDKSVTGLLNQLKIPLNPCLIKMDSSGNPDAIYKADLEKYHLLKDNMPAWSEYIYFEWTQTFPAGKVINIHHHYTPIVGESVPSPRSIADLNALYANDTKQHGLIWNVEPSNALTSIKPSILSVLSPTDNEKHFCLIPAWVRYQLTTGSNWEGGIGQFTLVLKDEAAAPIAVNSFYSSTDKATVSRTPSSMTFTINHFIPKKDLFALFLSLPQTSDDLKMCGM